MLSLFNPSAILATIVLAIGSFALGGYLGYDLNRGHEAKRLAAAQAEAISSAREQSFADAHAASQRARQAVVAEARARRARLEGVADAHVKARPSPVCGWDDVSLGLLYNAIDAANGTEGAAGRVPENVSGAADADERLGRIDTHMDLRGN